MIGSYWAARGFSKVWLNGFSLTSQYFLCDRWSNKKVLSFRVTEFLSKLMWLVTLLAPWAWLSTTWSEFLHNVYSYCLNQTYRQVFYVLCIQKSRMRERFPKKINHQNRIAFTSLFQSLEASVPDSPKIMLPNSISIQGVRVGSVKYGKLPSPLYDLKIKWLYAWFFIGLHLSRKFPKYASRLIIGNYSSTTFPKA